MNSSTIFQNKKLIRNFEHKKEKIRRFFQKNGREKIRFYLIVNYLNQKNERST